MEHFARDLGLDGVSVLESRLAAGCLIGVPRTEGIHPVSCPPRLIARETPCVLFREELNGFTSEVRRASYTLINQRRVGEHRLPKGSVVIAEGNRAQDQAIIRPVATARMDGLLRGSAREWIDRGARSDPP